MPNYGFNNYMLATVLYAYIILLLLSNFFGSYGLLSLLSHLGSMGRQLRYPVVFVRGHIFAAERATYVL